MHEPRHFFKSNVLPFFYMILFGCLKKEESFHFDRNRQGAAPSRQPATLRKKGFEGSPSGPGAEGPAGPPGRRGRPAGPAGPRRAPASTRAQPARQVPFARAPPASQCPLLRALPASLCRAYERSPPAKSQALMVSPPGFDGLGSKCQPALAKKMPTASQHISREDIHVYASTGRIYELSIPI
jgi:hypothetical protein